MNERKTLNDVFPDWVSGSGIFSALQAFPVPWKNENISSALDVEYHGNVSGEKFISPLVEKVLSGDVLTEPEKTLISTAIMAVNGTNWGKLWNTLNFEYDPIENYSMVEQMTNDTTKNEYGKTHTRTNNLSHSKTGTETDTPNITETQTPNLSNVSESLIRGFNSSDSVPTDSQTQSATGTNTNTRTGTDTIQYDVNNEYGETQTDNDGGVDTQTRNYTLKRSGNIGVTTSQQMIESERSLWMWNFFRNVVFPDIDRVLTLQIY